MTRPVCIKLVVYLSLCLWYKLYVSVFMFTLGVLCVSVNRLVLVIGIILCSDVCVNSYVCIMVVIVLFVSVADTHVSVLLGVSANMSDTVCISLISDYTRLVIPLCQCDPFYPETRPFCQQSLWMSDPIISLIPLDQWSQYVSSHISHLTSR